MSSNRIWAALAGLPLIACQLVWAEADHLGWRSYGGDLGNSHYSQLSIINTGNVKQLQPAWRYASANGATFPPTSELQVNPIIVDGVLYGRNPNFNVFAIDAANGKELWTFDTASTHVGLSNMRGLSYWESKEDRRILITTGHFLSALDARTGKLLKGFGTDGHVDLRQGLGRDPERLTISSPSPGVIFENLIILGSAVSETEGAAPGDIRAYNTITGELVWSFHTIPHPGEYGYNTWPEGAWRKAGGANAWAGLSVDTERATVYVATGAPTPDFDGSGRHGDNLFGNSIIALDARTGKRHWHYQTVHHDLWDRDLSSAPTLAIRRIAGKQQDVLAQASKQGVIYLLDRESGQPVFPIEEVAVPGSVIPGQKPAATQPRVTLPEPFARQHFSESELSNINPETHAYVKAQFDEADEFAYFKPIGLQKTILFPGFYGGANWGGGAFDPDSQIYYINATEVPAIVNYEAVEIDKGSQLGFGDYLYKKQCAGCHGSELQGFYPYAPPLIGINEKISKAQAMQSVINGKGRMMSFAHLSQHERNAALDYIFAFNPKAEPATSTAEQTETAYIFTGYNDFLDQRWYPAVKPPWGTLNAIDLNSGKRLWQVTLGEYEQLTKEGIAPTGTRNYGGPVVTAGGLVFIAATSDEKIRAFDKKTGELLWQADLPAAGYATPSTYALNGKQYLVITCSGGKLGTASGDMYVAFALP